MLFHPFSSTASYICSLHVQLYSYTNLFISLLGSNQSMILFINNNLIELFISRILLNHWFAYLSLNNETPHCKYGFSSTIISLSYLLHHIALHCLRYFIFNSYFFFFRAIHLKRLYELNNLFYCQILEIQFKQFSMGERERKRKRKRK